MNVIFYICSFLAIFSTILVVLQKNAIHALLYLIISFLAIASVFFSIGAFFIGSLEVIIYAGAIMVLFVFVIMMLNLGDQYDLNEKKYLRPIFWIGPTILSLTLFFLMIYVLFFLKNDYIDPIIIDSKAVGMSLFGPYILLVEFSSMLLLSALVVVFHLNQNKNYKSLNIKKNRIY